MKITTFVTDKKEIRKKLDNDKWVHLLNLADTPHGEARMLSDCH